MTKSNLDQPIIPNEILNQYGFIGSVEINPIKFTVGKSKAVYLIDVNLDNYIENSQTEEFSIQIRLYDVFNSSTVINIISENTLSDAGFTTSNFSTDDTSTTSVLSENHSSSISPVSTAESEYNSTSFTNQVHNRNNETKTRESNFEIFWYLILLVPFARWKEIIKKQSTLNNNN